MPLIYYKSSYFDSPEKFIQQNIVETTLLLLCSCLEIYSAKYCRCWIGVKIIFKSHVWLIAGIDTQVNDFSLTWHLSDHGKRKLCYSSEYHTKVTALVASLHLYQLMEELTDMKKDGTGLSKHGLMSNELSKSQFLFLGVSLGLIRKLQGGFE